MRKNKMARKCTTILVSCICHHTINSLSKTFLTKILNPPHITYMNISQSNISYRSGFNEFRFRNLYLKIWPVTQAFRLKCVFSAKSFEIKQNCTFQILFLQFKVRGGVHILRNCWTTLYKGLAQKCQPTKNFLQQNFLQQIFWPRSRGNDVIWWCFFKTDCTIEFYVLDLPHLATEIQILLV